MNSRGSAERAVICVLAGLLSLAFPSSPMSATAAEKEEASLSSRVDEILNDDYGKYQNKPQALVSLGSAVVTELITRLYADNFDARINVLFALGLISDPSTTSPLLEHLATVAAKENVFPFDEYTILTIEALGKLADKSATAPLVALLDGPHRGAVLQALQAIGDPTAESALVKLVDDGKAWLPDRLVAARIVCRCGSPAGVRQVATFVTNKQQVLAPYRTLKAVDGAIAPCEPPIKEWVEALAELRTDSSDRLLLDLVETEYSPSARSRGIELVAAMKSPAPILIDGLHRIAQTNDCIESVRLDAFKGLIAIARRGGAVGALAPSVDVLRIELTTMETEKEWVEEVHAQIRELRERL